MRGNSQQQFAIWCRKLIFFYLYWIFIALEAYLWADIWEKKRIILKARTRMTKSIHKIHTQPTWLLLACVCTISKDELSNVGKQEKFFMLSYFHWCEIEKAHSHLRSMHDNWHTMRFNVTYMHVVIVVMKSINFQSRCKECRVKKK